MVLMLLFFAPSDYTALKTVLQTPAALQLIVNTLNVLKCVSNSLVLSELHTASGCCESTVARQRSFSLIYSVVDL